MKDFGIVCDTAAERSYVLRVFTVLGVNVEPPNLEAYPFHSNNIVVYNAARDYISVCGALAWRDKVTLDEGILRLVNEAKRKAGPVLPVFPEPAKYRIKYKNSDGEERDYEISNPIEATHDRITTYAFGRGVRTFKKNRVLDITKV